jgi:hypothetical protein
LSDEDDSYEFYDGDDDDGESMYSERECLSFAMSKSDSDRQRNLTYVPKLDFDYTVIEIEEA